MRLKILTDIPILTFSDLTETNYFKIFYCSRIDWSTVDSDESSVIVSNPSSSYISLPFVAQHDAIEEINNYSLIFHFKTDLPEFSVAEVSTR